MRSSGDRSGALPGYRLGTVPTTMHEPGPAVKSLVVYAAGQDLPAYGLRVHRVPLVRVLDVTVERVGLLPMLLRHHEARAAAGAAAPRVPGEAGLHVRRGPGAADAETLASFGDGDVQGGPVVRLPLENELLEARGGPVARVRGHGDGRVPPAGLLDDGVRPLLRRHAHLLERAGDLQLGVSVVVLLDPGRVVLDLTLGASALAPEVLGLLQEHRALALELLLVGGEFVLRLLLRLGVLPLHLHRLLEEPFGGLGAGLVRLGLGDERAPAALLLVAGNLRLGVVVLVLGVEADDRVVLLLLGVFPLLREHLLDVALLLRGLLGVVVFQAESALRPLLACCHQVSSGIQGFWGCSAFLPRRQ